MRTSTQHPEGPPSETVSAPSLPALVEDLLHNPTDAQRKLKTKFWMRAADNPFLDRANVTQEMVRKITGSEAVLKYWHLPGFQAWFLNQDENREKLEDLYSMALDSMRAIFLSDDPKTYAAKVNALKLLAELAGKFPTAASKDKAAEAVSAMSKEELEEFLAKSGFSIEKRTYAVLDSTATPKAEG